MSTEKWSLLCPEPRNILALNSESFVLKDSLSLDIPAWLDDFEYLGKKRKLSEYAKTLLERATWSSIGTTDTETSTEGSKDEAKNLIVFKLDLSTTKQEDVPVEYYHMEIKSKNITIKAFQHLGFIRGVQTLYQLFCLYSSQQSPNIVVTEIPALAIEDYPDFEARGVLLDISRDRIPNMEYLKWLITNLSRMKINQFQFYIEHTFPYEGHEIVWLNSNTYSKEEFMQIDEWCVDNFIHLVPNQNSLGHMERWLIHQDYEQLAECPEGIAHPFAAERQPFTLNPIDERSTALVEDLFCQMAPVFKGNMAAKCPLFNANLDEPFDMGWGKSKSVCKRKSKKKVYCDYVTKVYDIIQRLPVKDSEGTHHHMLMWADVVSSYGERMLKLLPSRNITLLEWGYEAGHPWDKNCSAIAKSNRPFYVVPGNSSWCSLGGRTWNCITNLKEASFYGKKHGAAGYIIAEWGDYGHHQPLSIGWLGFAVGANFAWNSNKISIASSEVEDDEETKIKAWLGLYWYSERVSNSASTRSPIGYVSLWGSETYLNIKRCESESKSKVNPLVLARVAYDLGNVYRMLPTIANMSLLWIVLAYPEPLHDNHLVEFASNHFLGFYFYPSMLSACIGWVFDKFVSIFITNKKLCCVIDFLAEMSFLINNINVPTTRMIAETSVNGNLQQLRDELRFAADLMSFTARLWCARRNIGFYKGMDQIDTEGKMRLSLELNKLIETHTRIWLATSRQGSGLNDSVAKLQRLAIQLSAP